jgi:NitT/TauT family transport system permease protein
VGSRDYAISAGVLFTIWMIVSLLTESLALPSPVVVFSSFIGKLVSGELIPHIAVSAFRVLYGIFLALSFAIPIGLVTGSEEEVDRWISPMIYLLYPIPHIVLLPLVILLFGIGNASKIFLIALIVFFQILVTTRDAAKNLSKYYIYSMLSLGANKMQVYRHVIFPASLPKILTALRIGIGTAIAILFFVESFATTEGLGYYIMDSWGRADYVGLYSGIVGMALLGFSLYIILDRVEKKICKWKFV